MPPKLIPLPNIEKQYQNLETEAKHLDEAIVKAVDTIKQDFEKKRIELKDRLNRFKAEEQETVNIFQQTDTQLQQEMTRIGIAIENLVAGQSEIQQIETQDFHRRSQQIIQIFSDTHRDIENTIRDYRDKVRRVDQMASKTVTARPTTDVNQIKMFVEQRKNVSKDILQKLEDIHREMAKLSKNLDELESKEHQDMIETEKKCSNEEEKERKEEAKNFFKQAITLYGKK